MIRVLCFTGLLSVTLATSLSAGEGFLTKLPEPGTWVKYAVTQDMTRRGVPDQPQAGELTVRFLEADAEAGEACRWLEVDLEIAHTDGTGRDRETTKYLLPVKVLTGSSDPGSAVLCAWLRQGRDAEIQRKVELPDFLDAWQLTPPLADRQQRESPRSIAYQRGTLSADRQVRGHTEWRKANQVVRVQHEHWPHPDIPNGLAAARLETKISYPDVVRYVIITNYTLMDFGTGTTTALPHHR
ncbi:MAG TPA: hypothetical protein VM165_00575 [Planctomycetaceae bacterium]|nr:hypothetical protein [Planctomycetaceae bacterium]